VTAVPSGGAEHETRHLRRSRAVRAGGLRPAQAARAADSIAHAEDGNERAVGSAGATGRTGSQGFGAGSAASTASAHLTPHETPLPRADAFDSAFHAALARRSGSLSIASAVLAFADWWLHLAVSPGRQLDLTRLAWNQAARLASYTAECAVSGTPLTGRCAEPRTLDRRFADPAWTRWPFNVLQQSFLLAEQWWAAATDGVWAVEPHHAQKVAFAARQWLDLVSPGNFIATNPVVIERTLAEGGANLVRGLGFALDDLRRQLAGTPPAGSERYAVGRNLATTPGRVVLRNRLIELIQYTPRTPAVHPEPVLIVPAWIMKYYILDLAPGRSLVEYLLEQGHTVFCISWKNPTAEDRELGMEDYLHFGPMAALDAVSRIVPGRRVHATGYCLGGTLLAAAAAAMARDGDDRLATMTLFAAQTDFHEPGELSLFIDESQVGLLEAQMAQTGYLTSPQMAGAFQMLRSYDLLWSRLVGEYLLGERRPLNELMAWNADATRLPARMHSEYLRGLFLHNDLAEDRYRVGGRTVALEDIRVPVFIVGTLADHVAPWRSVYKFHHLSAAPTTFVLTSGGHNAGIVCPPGQPRRRYRLRERPLGAPTLAADDWLQATTESEGSWWPAWQAWLGARSGPLAKPPPLAPSLGDAPGRYVLQP
jgi:polyhydroxyalkanoate synthase subunit PhaC